MSSLSKKKLVSYSASPTASAFHVSDARIKLMVGNVGSGSSTACLFDCILRALNQTPDPDGVRRRVVLIARNSYPKLKTTVKRTMKHWLPDATGFELEGQAPITGGITRPLPDGTILDLQFILMAFKEPNKIEDDLASFEFSDMWINEAKEAHPYLLKFGQQRLGRAPAQIPDPTDPDPNGPNPKPPLFSGCDNPTIILDTNMYDDDHWLYKFFHVDHNNSREIVKFEQPPALVECAPDDEGARYFEYLDIYLKENPEAENIRWVRKDGYKYYWDIVETSPETVWTHVLNRVGTTSAGKAVFSSFYYNDRVHYKPTVIDPDPNYPLLIGIDWGIRYSSYVFCQYYDGGLKVLDELVIKDMGLRQQMDDYVVPLLNTRFINIPKKIAVVDPAGKARDPIDGIPTYTYMTTEWGIQVAFPPSNKPKVRIDSMKDLLRRKDGVYLSSNISVIRKGLQGKYIYKESRTHGSSNEIRYREEPDKNYYSHPMDAVCYVSLHVGSDDSINAMEQEYEEDEHTGVII